MFFLQNSLFKVKDLYQSLHSKAEIIRSTPLPRAFEWLAPWGVEQAVGLYHPRLGIWWLLPEMWLWRWTWFTAPKRSHIEQITYQHCKLWRWDVFHVKMIFFFCEVRLRTSKSWKNHFTTPPRQKNQYCTLSNHLEISTWKNEKQKDPLVELIFFDK